MIPPSTPEEALELARSIVARLTQMMGLGDPRATPEKLAAARRRLAALEGPGSVDLIEAQARASASVAADDVARPTRIGGVANFLRKIPAAVAAVAERVIRPKRTPMQEADVPALIEKRRDFSWNDYTRHCREVIAKALGGGRLGLRLTTLMGFIDALRGASGGKGIARPTYQWLRGRMDVCNETLSRCMRVLEDLGLLEVCNAYVWDKDGKQVRTANVYVPHFEGEIPDPPADVVADRLLPLAKQTRAKEWLAHISGLFVRPQGLNSTPLRAARPKPA